MADLNLLSAAPISRPALFVFLSSWLGVTATRADANGDLEGHEALFTINGDLFAVDDFQLANHRPASPVTLACGEPVRLQRGMHFHSGNAAAAKAHADAAYEDYLLKLGDNPVTLPSLE